MHLHPHQHLFSSDSADKPATDLDTGLKNFVKWYLNYYGDNTHHHSGLGNQEHII
jgi:UDP-glucuronate 4-epimerase